MTKEPKKVKPKKPIEEEPESEGDPICPDCGNTLIEEEGELVCPHCQGEINFLGEDEDEL